MNCHSGDMTIINFSDYESIYGKRAMIKYVIENNLMPIWSVTKHASPLENDLSLSFEEKQTILDWLDSDLPYRKKDIKLFNLKTRNLNIIKNPDYVIKLKEPIKIPATGFLPVKRLIFETNFKEDKWMKEIEYALKPKVVHHVLITVVDNKYLPHIKKKKGEPVPEKMIEGWAVGGTKFRDHGDNIGIKIPQNSFFIVQMHYEPIGEEVTDFESKIKFKFHSKIPEYSELVTRAYDPEINIPPYHDNYLSTMQYKVKMNVRLKGLALHMHLRGKSSSVFVVDPQGKKKEVFRLDPFNYNFQRPYRFKTPILVRENSKIVCENRFDNSIMNPINPDPSKYVKLSEYTDGEMSVCYFTFLIPSSQEHVIYLE